VSAAPVFSEDLLARVEEAGLNASAPPQQRLLDGWLLRFCPGKAKRARCINAISPGRLSVADKLARCEQAYAEAGLPLFVRITPFSEPSGLDASLDAAGLHRIDDTRVMVLAGELPAAEPPLPRGLRVRRVSHESFAQTVGSLRGSTLAQQQAHAHRLIQSPVPFTPYVLDRDGEVLCCAQTAVESDLVGLYDVLTPPQARRQGYAGLLCRFVLAQSTTRAVAAYLQVEGDNLAARTLYRRLGFRDGYAYHYRGREPRAA